MSSKRKTFHVDWDSPSHETGTVKRRPVSLNASFSHNNRFENIEYYELQDCVGGYSLSPLKSTELGAEGSIVADVPGTKEGEKNSAIKDNGNRSGRPRSSHPCKKGTPPGKHDDPEKFKASGRAKGVLSSYLIEQEPLRRAHSRNFEDREWKKDSFGVAKNNKFQETETNESDKRLEDVGKARSSDLFRERAEARNIDFDLRLPCESFERRSAVGRATRKISGARSRSLIPRPKVERSLGAFGLASSSSESSGFVSPLSPLSPQRDPSINTSEDTCEDVLRTSDSKSSGLGSPGSPLDNSPLSPESQTYSAFHLIQLQLEKLWNCPCEERQAEVIFVCGVLGSFRQVIGNQFIKFI